MSSVVLWSWVFLVASVGLFVTMGFIGMGRTKNADDFAVARNSYGPWVLGLAVVATQASGAVFLGCPASPIRWASRASGTRSSSRSGSTWEYS